MFNKKKNFFKDKIDLVTKNIWELEFKTAKSRQIREGVRLDRDRAIESIINIDNAIKANPKDENLPKQKAQFEENIKRYEAQMLMIDKQINGFAGTETEEPVIGIMEQLKSLAELRVMYRDYIKSL